MKQAYSLLVVDDEAISREHVLRDIRWEKLDVKELYEASGGLAALDLIRRHHPDIMILDLRMPEVDGLKVLETMREEKLEVQVIALSGYSDFEAARAMLASGLVVEYLLKPASEDRMFEAVYKCVERIEEKRLVRRIREQEELAKDAEWEDRMEPLDLKMPADRKKALIREAEHYIREHYPEKLTLDQVAQQVYVTPGYLSRLFSEIEGTGFTDYLTQVRMEEAKRLLKTRRNKIYEIAERVGYRDVKHFMRVFRKLEKCTPSEYREQILLTSFGIREDKH